MFYSAILVVFTYTLVKTCAPALTSLSATTTDGPAVLLLGYAGVLIVLNLLRSLGTAICLDNTEYPIRGDVPQPVSPDEP